MTSLAVERRRQPEVEHRAHWCEEGEACSSLYSSDTKTARGGAQSSLVRGKGKLRDPFTLCGGGGDEGERKEEKENEKKEEEKTREGKERRGEGKKTNRNEKETIGCLWLLWRLFFFPLTLVKNASSAY